MASGKKADASEAIYNRSYRLVHDAKCRKRQLEGSCKHDSMKSEHLTMSLKKMQNDHSDVLAAGYGPALRAIGKANQSQIGYLPAEL